jgi:hypothetical protein
MEGLDAVSNNALRQRLATPDPPLISTASSLLAATCDHKPFNPRLAANARNTRALARRPLGTPAEFCKRPEANRLPHAGRQRTDGPLKPQQVAALPAKQRLELASPLREPPGVAMLHARSTTPTIPRRQSTTLFEWHLTLELSGSF